MSHFIILGDSTGDVELLARMACGKRGGMGPVNGVLPFVEIKPRKDV